MGSSGLQRAAWVLRLAALWWWGVPSSTCLTSLTSPHPEGAKSLFSPQAPAPPDRVKDNTQGHGFNTSHRRLDPLYLPEFLSQPNGLPTSCSVFIPICMFHQRPHPVSVPVTVSCAGYQASPVARRAAFRVISISFQGPGSYQSQGP